MRAISDEIIEKKLNAINPHWSSGKIDDEYGFKPTHVAYRSLDEPPFYSLGLDDLCEKYFRATKEKSLEGKVIIFDEIQYLKNWDVQLKVLVDRYKGTKFLVSGPAAGALKRRRIQLFK